MQTIDCQESSESVAGFYIQNSETTIIPQNKDYHINNYSPLVC